MEEKEEEVFDPIYTTTEIEAMADRYFPIRNSADIPTYREHQRETIIKIAIAFFIDGKKFVALDGPVGCGKSAINYTVAMMVEKSVYLACSTPEFQG